MSFSRAGAEARVIRVGPGVEAGDGANPSCWVPPSGRLGHAALSDLGLPSRVHITEATLNHLDKAYEVEDGNGQQRDPYLKEMNIRTYLVIDPRVRGLGGGWGLGSLGAGSQLLATDPPVCGEVAESRRALP